MIRYLHLDCEMGGRELKYSLLTAYFLATDENFNVLGDLSLQLKPDDGNYIVNGKSMAVNGIDIIQHDKVAVTYKEAKPLLYKFLQNICTGRSVGEPLTPWVIRLTPVGHGVKGDIEHILDKIISEGSWEQFCTYHYIDTSVVLQFLRACGKIPQDTDGSISALSEYFGIQGPSVYNWHNAKFDTEMTMKVYEKMVELGKK